METEEKKPYMILMASQKGGVGKSTVALNLAIALRLNQNFRVLLVDEDSESASVSEQLGIKADGAGFQEALTGQAEMEQTLFAYQPIDLYLLPASPSSAPLRPKPDHLIKFHSKLARLKYDFIIVDNIPGFFAEEVARYFNDVAIVTTPDRVSAEGSAKMAEYCEKHKLEHRLIINRLGYSKFDLGREEIEKMYGDIAFQVVPEDKIVEEGLAKRKPAYLIDRDSQFSLAIDDLARAFALKRGGGPVEPEFERSRSPGFFERLGKAFFGR
jgi:MinD-like ATPase involved in chromosome partitioning or flagellar assembly